MQALGNLFYSSFLLYVFVKKFPLFCYMYLYICQVYVYARIFIQIHICIHTYVCVCVCVCISVLFIHLSGVRSSLLQYTRHNDLLTYLISGLKKQ